MQCNELAELDGELDDPTVPEIQCARVYKEKPQALLLYSWNSGQGIQPRKSYYRERLTSQPTP